MKNNYQVYVGNIGKTYEGSNKNDALKDYNSWVQLSRIDHGKASGEGVVFMVNGDIVKEYNPEDILDELEKVDPNTYTVGVHSEKLIRREWGLKLDRGEGEYNTPYKGNNLKAAKKEYGKQIQKLVNGKVTLRNNEYKQVSYHILLLRNDELLSEFVVYLDKFVE